MIECYIHVYSISIYIALEISNFQIQYSVSTTIIYIADPFIIFIQSVFDLLTFANRFYYPKLLFILCIWTRKFAHCTTLNHRK